MSPPGHRTCGRLTLRALLPLAALAFVLSAASADTQPLRNLVGRSFDARVTAVADGDTITIVLPGQRERIRVRLEGIDAPERGEPYSQRARQALRVLVFDQTVRVEGRDVDRYDRLVARVHVRGVDTSLELVRAGLACHYRFFSNDRALARAEADARAAGAGFWARGAPRPRCTTRR